MLIVGGVFEVDPEQRDAFLASRVEAMQRSRAEAGNQEYVLAADPVEPSRVILFEIWDDQASLDAHLAAMRTDVPAAPPAGEVPAPRSAAIQIYDVSGTRNLR